MPQLAANLSMLFTEHPFLERFAAARKAGFRYVEFLFPYEYETAELKKQLAQTGLNIVLFNLPSGKWAEGERGIAVQPERVAEFRTGVAKAITYALELGVSRCNCLVGKRDDALAREEQWSVLVENIRYAADAFREKGLNLLLEPLNHYDAPGFFLNKTQEVLQLIAEVERPNVYLQYDIYHAQREEGELTNIVRQHLKQIGHIQIADNPGRNQPGTGEINYRYLLQEIDALGYDGYVSLEYVPKPDTLSSLSWVEEHGFKL